MEISAGIQASLAGRYASALFELASEAGNVSAVEADLEKLASALAESADLSALIRNPQVSRADLGKAMAALGEMLELTGLTRNFLGVLAQNRRVSQLPAIIAAFNS
ncbi:MAG TPA: F0F1 ATP synthase subunit delta, partial [Sphingomonadaceae bacterium]|nr:F0F1 ATP synthase subunit delta [Sphingomonadaceae bacterium]